MCYDEMVYLLLAHWQHKVTKSSWKNQKVKTRSTGVLREGDM